MLPTGAVRSSAFGNGVFYFAFQYWVYVTGAHFTKQI